MRIEFERTSDVPLTALTLRLDYDDRKADYDWIFNFTLLANAGPLGRLHARGECPWYDKRRVDPQDGSATVPNTLMLGCGIDCDGGSMSLSRAVGADAVELEFADYGMLMKLGCGGGGRIRVYPARSDAGSFRLERVAPSRCEALKNLP